MAEEARGPGAWSSKFEKGWSPEPYSKTSVELWNKEELDLSYEDVLKCWGKEIIDGLGVTSRDNDKSSKNVQEP